MTTKERVFAIFRGRPADHVPWLANMDHWYGVNRARGTIPAKYRDWPLHDIQRDLGCGLWQRAGVCRGLPNEVRSRTEEIGEEVITIIETPVGSLREVHRICHDFTQARMRVEFLVKGPRDLRVATYIAEASHYEPNGESFLEAEKAVGEGGIALTTLSACPIMQAWYSLGVVGLSYALADYRQQLEAYLHAEHERSLRVARCAAEGPAEVVCSGGNMDAQVIGPESYKRYALEAFQEIGRILHARGKLHQYHFDGFVKPLLPLINDSEIDIIEAFTPQPMGDVSLEQALETLAPHIKIQGAIPASLLCHGATQQEFEDFVVKTVEMAKAAGRVVIGLGDNTPPDAEVERLRRISELVAQYG